MGLRDLFRRSERPTRVEPTVRAVVKLGARSFDAGVAKGVNVNWSGSNLAFDELTYRGLRLMRARSRDLAANNAYMKRFIGLCQNNIIGPQGVRLHARAKMENGSLDTGLNEAILDAWKRWGNRYVCDIRRLMSFRQMQRVIVGTVARDGECLIRKVKSTDANGFGYGLQLVAIDRLDIELNKDLSGGARIRMGVELSAAGAPIAYHLLTRHPGDRTVQYAGRLYDRVPAGEIVHLFLPQDPEQTRGIPWAHAAMVNLENLGGFDEAAVIAARIGASKMGFYVNAEGAGDDMSTGTFGDGTLAEDMEPGQIGVLPMGYDWKGWDPRYPDANYDPFTKACIRGISAGLGASYTSLSNDLSGVNYSSIRQGVLDERDAWMTLQEWFIDGFMEDNWYEWSRFAILTGQIQPGNRNPISLARLDKIRAGGEFQGRRWSWVDPLKDVQASQKQIASGLISRRRVAANMGIDLDQVWDELKAEEDKADEMGLDVSGKSDSVSSQPNDATSSDNTDGNNGPQD